MKLLQTILGLLVILTGVIYYIKAQLPSSLAFLSDEGTRSIIIIILGAIILFTATKKPRYAQMQR
ncbi:MAG: hypothetical protein Q7R56_03555 [Nanoarchaeota archaeon]|nr:hypothetical protein [Nanoarchaeota archaeon]